MSRRILLLTLYYPPDLSACAFRAQALVRALTSLDSAPSVDVVTSVPHRYASFVAGAQARDVDGRVSIERLPMPAHRSDMASQAVAYAAFASRVRRATAGRQYDLVIATSSRLMTASLGAHVARRLRVPLYLDIRDLFADAMREVLPGGLGVALAPVLSHLERWTIARAVHVNVVSPGFVPYLRARYPELPMSVFTNGIDDEFLVPPAAMPAPEDGVRTIVYAGNIGEGQGLHTIVPPLAAALAGRARFRIIGDGGRREALAAALAAQGAVSVTCLPPMPRARLVDEYRAADALFLHLNDYEAFTRVLPSKVFEYAAMARPVWAGVRGVAAELLTRDVDNAAVFPPGDVPAALAAYERLRWEVTPRSDFIARYARASVMQQMAAHVQELIR